jgi:hypothetical protein
MTLYPYFGKYEHENLYPEFLSHFRMPKGDSFVRDVNKIVCHYGAWIW